MSNIISLLLGYCPGHFVLNILLHPLYKQIILVKYWFAFCFIYLPFQTSSACILNVHLTAERSE